MLGKNERELLYTLVLHTLILSLLNNFEKLVMPSVAKQIQII